MRYLLLALLVSVAPIVSPAELSPLIPPEGPWVVRVTVDEREALDRLAAEVDVWEVAAGKELASGALGWVVTAAVSGEQLAALRARGLEPQIDARASAELHAPRRAYEGQIEGIPGFPCYRTVEETYADAAALAATYPQLASWTDIGDSWEKLNGPGSGYDLFVLKLTNSAVAGPKPKLYYNGGIHAREYTTPELGMRFAEHLLAEYGVDPDVTWLLDHHELHLMPHANPDGRKIAETGVLWRKNVNDDACTTSDYGVDLNRNFEFQWGCCGGSSSNGCSAIYRGASPASEPEDQAIQAYLRSIFPDQRDPDLTSPAPVDSTGVMLDVHSFGEDVLWSWGFTSVQPPNGAALYTLGRKYAYFTDYYPQHGSFGTVDGSTKDFAYGDLGVPGFTIELGTTFFQSCSSFESTILPDNLDSLLYTLKVVRTPYLTPAGPEAVAPSLSSVTAAPGDLVDVSATIDDTRYSSANGVEPTQDVAAAELTVDTPPWQAGAGGQPMSPDDGAFDSGVEAVSATLDTTGLALGRHLIYVRGQDAAGNWGPPSALFLEIVDPASSPRIAGTVSDAESGAPLAAVVTTGLFNTATDPATGAYELLVPEGTYTLTASADDHAPVSVGGVQAIAFQTTTVDFELPPYVALLDDDVEGGAGDWSADAPWAITSEAANSPTRSWTDSPGGSYANDADTSLTSAIFDLGDYVGTRLSLWQRYDLESGFDFGRVEISIDGGASWSEVLALDGTNTAWHQLTLELPQLDGVAAARFRFRLTSDGSVTRDGWYVDDIVLRAARVRPPLTAIFSDGFESGDLASWTTVFP